MRRCSRILLVLSLPALILLMRLCEALGLGGGLAANVWTWVTVALGISSFNLTQHNSLIRILAATDDHRVIGPLAEALDLDDAEARKAARTALIRLLPQLQATDADLLTQKQRRCLHRALTGTGSHLRVAILKAFEQIGDERDLAAVNEACSPYSPVRHAAKACLPYLQARIADRQCHQTLLRASDGAGTTPDTLLRPAAGHEDSRSDTLLRATNGSEEEGTPCR